MPGVVRELRFDNASGDTSPVVRENLETGTLAIADGVAPGTTYTVTALVPPERSDEELRGLPIVETGSDFELEVLPPQINNLAADITEGIDFGWGQVAAVRDRFTATGFYDKSTNTPPGHSYFRLAQFLADPDEIIGFEEQYAAGAAVVTRIAGLPTRVVAGFEIPADRYAGGVAEVRSGDASAWIEVRVEGVGWVPVSVTPPRSREPDTEAAVTPDQQVATPNPPPPPQVPPDIDVVNENRELEEPVEEEEEEEKEDDASVGGGIGLLGWIGVGVGILIGMFAAFCAIVVAWKYRRMRRRREAAVPSLRIAGGVERGRRPLRRGGRADRPPLDTPRDGAGLHRQRTERQHGRAASARTRRHRRSRRLPRRGARRRRIRRSVAVSRRRGARPARRPVPAPAGPDAARPATAVPPRRVATGPSGRRDGPRSPPTDEAETDA